MKLIKQTTLHYQESPEAIMKKMIYTQDFVFSSVNRSDSPGAIRFKMNDPEGNTLYIDVSAAEAFKLSSKINNFVKSHLESV